MKKPQKLSLIMIIKVKLYLFKNLNKWLSNLVKMQIIIIIILLNNKLFFYWIILYFKNDENNLQPDDKIETKKSLEKI